MKSRRWVSAIPISSWALFCVCWTGSIALSQDAIGDRVRTLAQPYIDAEMVAGLSIGVVVGDSDSEIHLGRVRRGGAAPDGDTIYEIGSVSKVFTGILLADAVHQNRVQLDQPAQQLLPAGVTMPGWNDKPITLVDLATHSSGLPRLADNMPSLSSDNPYADYTSELAHQFLSSHTLRREPGSKHEYSNFGMSLLGHLLSDHADTSYDELLTRRITQPLGMVDTRVTLTDSMKSRLASPHIGADRTTVNWDFADLPGAGGIRSSTRDMLRFAKANLDPPHGDLGRALETAWKVHRPGLAGEPSMGLGWHLAGDGSTRWHNGQTGGYHSMLLVNRQLGIAVVLLSNTALMELDSLANDVIRMLAGAEVEPRTFEASVKVAPEVMQRYVGRYQLAPNFIFTVSVENEKLMVGLTGQPTFQVFPRSETEWFYKVVKATLTFKQNEDGQCNEVELFQNGVRQTANRIE